MAEPTDAAKEPKQPVQKFKAVHNVHASSGAVAPGASIALTREEFDVLKASGSIEGEWKDK